MSATSTNQKKNCHLYTCGICAITFKVPLVDLGKVLKILQISRNFSPIPEISSWNQALERVCQHLFLFAMTHCTKNYGNFCSLRAWHDVSSLGLRPWSGSRKVFVTLTERIIWISAKILLATKSETCAIVKKWHKKQWFTVKRLNRSSEYQKAMIDFEGK